MHDRIADAIAAFSGQNGGLRTSEPARSPARPERTSPRPDTISEPCAGATDEVIPNREKIAFTALADEDLPALFHSRA